MKMSLALAGAYLGAGVLCRAAVGFLIPNWVSDGPKGLAIEVVAWPGLLAFLFRSGLL